MLYCYAWCVEVCDFTTEDKDELKEHEATAHPIKYKKVGTKPMWNGYKNIYEKED